MKIEPSPRRNAYHVLGVPAFADARLVRSAYLKRVEMLGNYRFDKATQTMEWQVVNEILQELNDAYAQLCPAKQTKAKSRERGAFSPVPSS